MRISRGILRGAPAVVKQGVSAGRRPAPAEAFKPRQVQQPKQKRVSWGRPGWGRLRGPLQVHPCKLGRRLLVCAVLRTRQDRGWASCPTRPRHASGPCGSRPRNRTHPAFDRFPRSVGNALGDLTPEFHSISDGCVDQGRHLPKSTGNLSGVGRCGAAGPLAPWRAPSSPHGRVYGVSCSLTPPRPILSTAGPLWLLLWPRQVQGAALPNPHFTQLSISPWANGPSFAFCNRPCASNSTL